MTENPHILEQLPAQTEWVRVRWVEQYLGISHMAVYKLLKDYPEITTFTTQVPGENRGSRFISFPALKAFVAKRVEQQRQG
jgi:hypothetical protein